MSCDFIYFWKLLMDKLNKKYVWQVHFERVTKSPAGTKLEDRNQLLHYTEQNFDVCPKPGYTTQCILNNSIDK